MNRKQLGITTLAVCLMLSGPLAFAKPSSHGNAAGGGTEIPSGFSKGQKKGWQGGTKPPGWSKGKKKGWGEAGMPPGLVDKSDSSNPSQSGQS